MDLLRWLEPVRRESQGHPLSDWADHVRRRVTPRWPVVVNCTQEGNWDVAFAVYPCDAMARVRLERVQGVLDSMQIDLGMAGDAARPKTLEDKRREAMQMMQQQQRARYTIVEG